MSEDTPESTGTQSTAPVSADSTAPPVTEEPASAAPARKTAAKKTAKKAPAKKTAGKTAAAKKTTKKAAVKKTAAADEPLPDVTVEAAAEVPADASVEVAAEHQPAKKTAKKAPAKKSTAKKSTSKKKADPAQADTDAAGTAEAEDAAPALLFQAPEATAAAKKASSKPKSTRSTKSAKATKAVSPAEEPAAAPADEATPADAEPTEAGEPTESGDAAEDEGGSSSSSRRRRRRGGRRRRKPGDGAEGSESGDGGDDAADGDVTGVDSAGAGDAADGEAKGDSDDGEGGGSSSSRRRRRRRRAGDDGGDGSGGDDPANTVTRVRQRRAAEDQITAVSGSTRLEAKKQRRREGREAGRRRAPIVSEAEFLARRESVDRVMVIRQREELTQIAVLEDKVLVEHYVARESQTSLIGNVYLGRVQNVLPSMEAAFVDIGKGRNAVLYAGEVNWQALGHKDGQPRKIESVLSSGQSVLVQVTKDPVGHKGARLTSQISLAGRFLVYVPDGTTSGISRKLPDTERNRLKTLLKEIVPDSAGVIVRTAAEGAAEDELTRDVERLKARWEDIEKKSKGSSPQLLYGEPDLTLKVVRDLFTEDFSKLVIEGDEAWETVQGVRRRTSPPTSRSGSSATPTRRQARDRQRAATCSRRTGSTSRSPRASTARSGCPRAAR